MRTIIYLHGFCASSQSVKAQILQTFLAQKGLAHLLLCPDLHHRPQQALNQAADLIEKNIHRHALALMGSSLGGHYASVLAERYQLPTVLINPAVIAKMNLSLFLGEHQNFYTHEKFTLTQKDVDALKWQVRRPSPRFYWLLQEAGDEVLNPLDAQQWFAGAKSTIFAQGNHSFTRFADVLPFLLEWLWNFADFPRSA